MMKTGRLLIVGLCAAAGVALCLPLLPRKAQEPVQAPPPEEKAVPVNVGGVERRAVPQYLQLTGELQADKDSSVATDAAGIVVAAPVERGTVVAAGDVLARLDDREAKLAVQETEAELASAKADLEYARLDLGRNAQLVRSHAVSMSAFQKATADHGTKAAAVLVKEAKLAKARKSLKDCLILAPFAGAVAEREVQVGEYVQSGSVVARLVKASPLRLVLNVPETATSDIHLGQEVRFTAGTCPGQTFSAKVKHVGAAVRSNARDLVIEAEVAAPEGPLIPGMFVAADLSLRPVDNPAVPLEALRKDGEGSRAFVVQEGRAVEKCVETGVAFDSWVEVRGGLKPGERIVLNPDSKLKDGMSVKIL